MPYMVILAPQYYQMFVNSLTYVLITTWHNHALTIDTGALTGASLP